MQHLVAYQQSVDLNGVLTAINAVQDSQLFVSGTTVRVPNEMPFLSGGVLVTAATTWTDAQIQTPSLREVFYPSVAPILSAQGVANTSVFLPITPNSVLPLAQLENMQFWANTDAAAAQLHTGLVWIQDGPVAPVNGPIFTIAATAAVVFAAGAWTNGQLTFNQQLPAGDYQIVGMRASGANVVAARLVLAGQFWRPGVLAVAANNVGDFPVFRYGQSGSFGVFNNNVPPTVDFLGIGAGATQQVWLDLIKVK